MSDKDQWFLDELERQRKCHKYVKLFSNVTLYLLGCLTGMIGTRSFEETQAPLGLLIIALGGGYSFVCYGILGFSYRDEDTANGRNDRLKRKTPAPKETGVLFSNIR